MTNLRPIGEESLKVGDYIYLPWIFDKWYEKVILVVLCSLGLWKLFQFFV